MPEDQQRVISCFISYAHRGVDRDTLDALIELLVEESNEKINLLIDEELDYGADLEKFMTLLESVDATLLLMTPEYKKRVVNREGGVYQEYRLIYERYQRAESTVTLGPNRIFDSTETFELLPILFSGTKQESVPDDISYLKYLDLVGFRGRKSKDVQSAVTSDMRNKFGPKIRKLTHTLEAIVTPRMDRYRSNFKENFDRLFINLKADWSHLTDDTIFVKTSTFRKVLAQEVYIIVGRKGSGKSTITDYLPWQNKTVYKGHIGIRTQDLDLERCYGFLSSAQTRSDLLSVFSGIRSFQMAWELFIYFCCMKVIIDVEEKGDLNSHQREYVKPIRSLLHEICSVKKPGDGQTICIATLFTFCWDSLRQYMSECINQARPDERFFITDVVNSFTLENFLIGKIGREALFAFREIVKTCRRKFLVTFDGFDTQFNEFRMASLRMLPDQREIRVQFELDWLRSLLAVVLKIKEDRQQEERYYRLMDFCIAIPKDRFEEIRQIERDRYVYHGRFGALSWSGIELVILLRKRLEVMTGCRTRKGQQPEERLEEVLRKTHVHIPWDVEITLGDRQYELPLFLYVLRNTFWRPREVLMHYAGIIALADDMRRRKLKVSAEAVQWSIKRTNGEIIKSELINEFKSTITNIEDIINKFAKCPQILSYDVLSKILREINFEVAWGADQIRDIHAKIDFLYSIGVLGIRATKTQQARMNLRHKDAFFFNEGRIPLQSVSADKFSQFEYIIHPIFCDYLNIDSYGEEMVLEYTWFYLKEMEALLYSGIGFEESL